MNYISEHKRAKHCKKYTTETKYSRSSKKEAKHLATNDVSFNNDNGNLLRCNNQMKKASLME